LGKETTPTTFAFVPAKSPEIQGCCGNWGLDLIPIATPYPRKNLYRNPTESQYPQNPEIEVIPYMHPVSMWHSKIEVFE